MGIYIAKVNFQTFLEKIDQTIHNTLKQVLDFHVVAAIHGIVLMYEQLIYMHVSFH